MSGRSLRMKYFDSHVHLTGSIPIDYWRKVLIQKRLLKARTKKSLEESMTLENSSTWSELKVCTETPTDFVKTVNTIVVNMIKNDCSGANFIFNPFSLLKRGLNLEKTFRLLDILVYQLRQDFNFITIFRIGANRRDGIRELENVGKIYESYRKRYKWIEGIDINGCEKDITIKTFIPTLKIFKKADIPFTIHAGEGLDLMESLYDAISCSPIRIGHGFAALGNSDLIKELSIKQIPLEICITSNIYTCAMFRKNYMTHPIRIFKQNNIPIFLGTDNPEFLHTTIKKEFLLATKICKKRTNSDYFL